jgi:HEAT repeat protein
VGRYAGAPSPGTGDVETLLDLLGSTKRLERVYAVANLGETDDPRVRVALLRCLSASDDNLRVGALKALTKLAVVDAVPDMYEVATTDESDGVRVTAIQGLIALDDPRGVGLAVEMLGRSDLPWPRWYGRWATKKVVELGAVEAVPGLERAARVQGPITRLRIRRAIRALRRLQTESKR